MATIGISVIAYSKVQATVDVPDSLKITTDLDTPNEEGHGCFRVLSVDAGDERVIWDRNDPDQIRDAKGLFASLLNQGQVPYAIGYDGKPNMNKQLTDFDPNAEEIVFIPTRLVVGG